MSPAQQPTAVIYLRVSTKEQAEKGGDTEGFSIPAQREACLRKAQALGAIVMDEFADRGESARSSARPELQRMMSYLAEAPTAYVIVHKVDRLARNRADDVEINLSIRKAGATLVSCTENIDETPSGMLLHGIMSSIAEFYSRNLATEVKKGAVQKAKAGGTVGKAPLGYLNVRRIENGREIRTVEVDPVRGPLMRYAFERYAQGDINLRELLADLTERGLRTTPGAKRPSKVLEVSHLHSSLTHPYYKGLVRYEGVLYPGRHEPLVSEETWDQVQATLAAKNRVGEKNRKYPHYLKSTVFCGDCGSRLIVSNNRNGQGTIYPYFICVGRQQRRTNCTQRAILIETVERLVEQHYQTIQPSAELTRQLEALIRDEIQLQRTAAEQEHAAQLQRRSQLVAEQTKLLQAHYADAITLDLLKSEQDRIRGELAATDKRLRASSLRFDEVEANLDRALAHAASSAGAYLSAGPTIRRQMNQAIFRRIYVDHEGGVTSDLNEPFELLLSPELVTAARDHAELLSVEPDHVERELRALYEEWSREQEAAQSGANNKQTPSFARRSLKYRSLVDRTRLELVTSRV